MWIRIKYILLLVFSQSFITYAQYDINYMLLSAAESNDTATINLLISKGADVNYATYEGVTPLMYAAENNSIEAALLFLNNKVNVNAKPWNGVTALIAAVKAQNLEMAELLIRNNADINAQTTDSISSLMYASAFNYYYITDMLLYYDADISLKDINGNNALMLATYFGNSKIVNLLLKNGADLQSIDYKGNSLLHKAVESNNTELVNFFIQKNLNVNYINNSGLTPLALAAKSGNTEIIQILLNNNADVNLSTNSNSPIEIAQNNQHYNAVKILKSDSAIVNYWPQYNHLILSINNQFNANTFFVGINTGLYDYKYNSFFRLVLKAKPFPNRVLIKYEQDFFYQYWEYRYILGLEFGKNFLLNKSNNKSYGIYTTIGTDYSFGSFIGTKEKPKLLFLFNPGTGVLFKSENFKIKIGYCYENFNTLYISNHFIVSEISYSFGNKQFTDSMKLLYYK